ncbi:MAG: type II secretion system protein, partial [Chthoniobacterales bacterium]
MLKLTSPNPPADGRCPANAAFTLIELLIVIAIIAILAGLGFPAVQGALNNAKKAQARNDVQQIAAAVRAFELEYGRQPSTQTGNDQFLAENSPVIRALMGEDESLNPRKIRFLEAKTTTSRKGGLDPDSMTYYDPWGTPYFIKLNTDYNNTVEYYGDNFVTVVVGS